MSRPQSHDQHLWIDDLVPGSVVLWGNRRTERVVREATGHYRKGYEHRIHYVRFVIMHCSWTHRPDTIYTRSDVLRIALPTNIVVDLSSDAFHQEFVRNMGSVDKRLMTMDCCDVKGIA